MLLAWIGAVLWPVVLFLVWRDAKRRRAGRWSFARRFWSSLFTALWTLCVWAFLIEPETLVARRVTVESAQWQGPPLRIGLISDTHVGSPHVDAARMARIVARMNGEHPDLVALLGDYVGGHERSTAHSAAENREILAGIAAFGKLSAPLGKVAVFGNHDWWYDDTAVADAFARIGVPLLANKSLRLARPGAPFWIAGLDDAASLRRRPSFDAALRDVPLDAPVIALGHRPDIFFDAPARVAITLVGHTHGGQINFPLLGRPVAVSRGSRLWPWGAFDVDARKLYVTSGIGISGLPARLNQPPEIVVLTLKRAPDALAPDAR